MAKETAYQSMNIAALFKRPKRFSASASAKKEMVEAICVLVDLDC